MADALHFSAETFVRRGRRLERITIAYNCLEGLIAFFAGWAAGSVSLTGFGLDSLIEVASGTALLWRLRHHADPERRERAERIAVRVVGACFVGLALYVAAESAASLAGRHAPERSVLGILIAGLSVLVMPVLARAKRRVAAGLGSAALRADSRQSDFCAYLSAILLAGLLLNALLGWWWADPAAGLAMVPLIAKEGLEGLRGKSACDACHAPHSL